MHVSLTKQLTILTALSTKTRQTVAAEAVDVIHADAVTLTRERCALVDV